MMMPYDWQEVRLVVDRCKSAVIAESMGGQTSSQDRRPCDVISRTPGPSTLISVNAPLQLGGRSSVKVKYPNNVIRDGFDGCIKNFMHNGQVSLVHVNLHIYTWHFVIWLTAKTHPGFFHSLWLPALTLASQNPSTNIAAIRNSGRQKPIATWWDLLYKMDPTHNK